MIEQVEADAGLLQARTLKVLAGENGRFERLLADAMLDNTVLKEVAAKLMKPAARGLAMNHTKLLRLYREENLRVRRRRGASEPRAHGHP